MKRDVTEIITKASVVPGKLKLLEKLMKYKDKEIYINNKRKRKGK